MNHPHVIKLYGACSQDGKYWKLVIKMKTLSKESSLMGLDHCLMIAEHLLNLLLAEKMRDIQEKECLKGRGNANSV